MINLIIKKGKKRNETTVSAFDVFYAHLCYCLKERKKSTVSLKCEDIIGNFLDAPQVIKQAIEFKMLKKYLLNRHELEMTKFSSINIDNYADKDFDRFNPEEDHKDIDLQNEEIFKEHLRFILNSDLTLRSKRVLLSNLLKSHL